jgi:hypothetical protein
MAITISGSNGVSGVDGTAGTPTFEGSTATAGIFYPAANVVGFSTASTERFRVDSSGNVNIATNGVSAKLYVLGNAAMSISAGGSVTSSQTPDFSTANNFSYTLGASITLNNPTNLTAGQSGIIYVTQDATGSRTLAYGSYWKFPNGVAPVLTTTASATDAIVYYVRTTTSITCNYILNIG